MEPVGFLLGGCTAPGLGKAPEECAITNSAILWAKPTPARPGGNSAAIKHFFSMLVPFRGVQAFLSSSLFKTPGSGIVSLHELTPVLPNPWSCRQVHLVVYPVNQYLLSNTEVHSSILPPYIPCDLSSWLSYCHSTSRSMQIHHERHFSK